MVDHLISYINTHFGPYRIEIMAHTGISLTYLASYLSRFDCYAPIVATLGGFVLLGLSIKGQSLKNKRERLEIERLERIEKEMEESKKNKS